MSSAANIHSFNENREIDAKAMNRGMRSEVKVSNGLFPALWDKVGTADPCLMVSKFSFDMLWQTIIRMWGVYWYYYCGSGSGFVVGVILTAGNREACKQVIVQ